MYKKKYLVTVGVAADDDGLLPAGDNARDVLDDDGLAEDGTAEDVPDGSVGAGPHLLEVELCSRAKGGG